MSRKAWIHLIPYLLSVSLVLLAVYLGSPLGFPLAMIAIANLFLTVLFFDQVGPLPPD